MKKTILISLFLAVAGLFTTVIVGCVPYYQSSAQAKIACTPGDPGVETIKVQMVCPYVGASYETLAVKCPGDDHFRIDVVCKLCGHRHHYNIRYWPDDYWDQGYVYYWGWFYPQPYWNHYKPYVSHPRAKPGQHPRYMPHPRMYPDRNLNRPHQVRPPAPRVMPRNAPPPPNQFGQPHPPPRPPNQHHKENR